MVRNSTREAKTRRSASEEATSLLSRPCPNCATHADEQHHGAKVAEASTVRKNGAASHLCRVRFSTNPATTVGWPCPACRRSSCCNVPDPSTWATTRRWASNAPPHAIFAVFPTVLERSFLTNALEKITGTGWVWCRRPRQVPLVLDCNSHVPFSHEKNTEHVRREPKLAAADEAEAATAKETARGTTNILPAKDETRNGQPDTPVAAESCEGVVMIKQPWNILVGVWRWIVSWWTMPPERLWDLLPEESLARIAQELDGKDLFAAAQVCSRWRNHMDSKSMWKQLCKAEFDEELKQLEAQLPLYEFEWKKLYCKKPRLRFDGAYSCSNFLSPYKRSALIEANHTSWLKFFERERKVVYLRSQGRKLSKEKAKLLSLDQQATSAKFSTWMRSITFSFFCSSGVESFFGTLPVKGGKVCANRMLIDTEVKHTNLRRRGTVWEFQPLPLDAAKELSFTHWLDTSK